MQVQIDCVCPPRADGEPRHPDGDTVTLRETLGFREVTAIRHGISFLENDGTADAYAAEVLAVLTEGYVLHGIEAWSLVDEKGKPAEVSRTAIRERILSRVDVASVVGDAADELYGEKVLLPLLVRASKSSQPSPTGRSTSPRKGSRASRPTPSSPSSTSTTPTDGTVTTTGPLVGVSSFSQSSESAA
jgi:hypothetical protein